MELELQKLEKVVNNKIYDFVSEYHQYPRYIKLPLWVFEALKQTMSEVDLKKNYQTDEFTLYNLKVCETTSINKIEQMEVF